MIRLSFCLPEPGSSWFMTWEAAKQGDPASISEIDLRYKYFGVNVEMVVDDVEMISKKRFVTLVDMALSISEVVARISRGEDAMFGFTESEDVIRLHREVNSVSVESSRTGKCASVSRDELIDTFSTFLREVHSRLINEVPRLGENSTIRKVVAGLS